MANFLGVANVIEGAVANGRFRSADGEIEVPLDGLAEGPASIVFRPQNLALCPPGAVPAAGTVGLDGIIGGMEFLGGIIRYSVRVGPHALLVDAPHQKDDAAFAVGQTVALHLDAERIIGLAG